MSELASNSATTTRGMVLAIDRGSRGTGFLGDGALIQPYDVSPPEVRLTRAPMRLRLRIHRGGDQNCGLCDDPDVEVAWLLAGVILGAIVAVGAVLVRDRIQRRALVRRERLEMYARALGLHDASYRLVDFLITWPRRANQTAQPVPGEQPTTRAAAIVNNASVELDSTLRDSRDVIARIQLVGGTSVIERAKDMQTSLEMAVLALRVDSPARLESNWSVVRQAWREAREQFAEAARDELA
jgi:hypothetical protein